MSPNGPYRELSAGWVASGAVPGSSKGPRRIGCSVLLDDGKTASATAHESTQKSGNAVMRSESGA